MNTITLTLDDALMADVVAEAKRRSISVEQAAADMIALKAYEAKHGPVDPDHLAELDEAIAEADRGEFASDEEVQAFFKRHGA
jgi:hypothetical protein